MALKYYNKVRANLNNPIYDNIFNPKYKESFEQKENAIKPFGLRIIPTANDAALPTTRVLKPTISKIPPWEIITPEIDLSLSKHQKEKTHPTTFQEVFNKIKEKYPNHIHIYTDGSKQNDATASATVLNKSIKKQSNLPKETSIFSGEIYALTLALNLISNNKNPKYIIFSDSLFALKAIKNKKAHNPLIAKLLNKLTQLNNQSQKETIFC